MTPITKAMIPRAETTRHQISLEFPRWIWSLTYLICLFPVLSIAITSDSIATAQISHQSTRPVFDERFDDWPLKLKTNGRVLIYRDVKQFGSMTRFLGRLTNNKIVAACAGQDDALAVELKRLCDRETKSEFSTFSSAPSPLKKALASSDTVYLSSANCPSETVLAFKSELVSFVGRGGNLIVDSELGQLLGRRIAESNTEGLNLIFDCMVNCSFDGSTKAKQDLLNTLAKHPRTVGVGIEPNTMTILSGRQLFSFGPGTTTVMLPSSDTLPESEQKIGLDRASGETSRIDLTQWRRMAIDRDADPFPPAKPRIPYIENGTLFIVGGGGTPRGLMTKMIEMAGGRDKAKPVYIPCSESDEVNQRQGTVEMWRRMGVKQATFIHTKNRTQANTDETFLKPLNEATMLWFGGGRQWNFADSYFGTEAHRRMKAVLHRGGVVGGSSAGASIQGRFLARATPIGNSNILAPGYERGGLGFLSGVAIDQHFSQRGRQKDMTKLIKKYPQLLGIGIDESTAIMVQKSKATVIGNGKVFFYDANQESSEDGTDYVALPAGGVYDLANRKVIENPSE